MAAEELVNFQSLSVVRDELVATIETAAKDLEVFVGSHQEDADSLQNSINGIHQIIGIFKMLQLSGACLLAEELFAVANEISPGAAGKGYDRKMEVISNTFFVLTRYLEYVQQSRQRAPVLLIPHINALRKAHNKSVLPESHFLSLRIDAEPQLPEQQPVKPVDGQFRQEVRRIRQMYQIGLIGILRDTQQSKSIALLRRGCKKMFALGGSQRALAKLWWLADVALESFVLADMTFLDARKFLFTRIEKILRQVELGGEKAFDSDPPKGLVKELVYLITLSGAKSERGQQVMETYGLSRFPYTDSDLMKEYEAMYGPSAHTVSSLASVLQAEISNTKRIIENAAQSSSQRIDDMDGFLNTLKNVAEILSVVGLVSASHMLKEQIVIAVRWTENKDSIPIEELQEVANNLLYLESTVQGLDSSKLSAEKLKKATSMTTRSNAVLSNELASAIRIVIEESLSGLALTKRALNSFSESNFDTAHIKNIARTLSSIRGAMFVLNCQRVEKVLARSAAFVNDVLLDQELPAAVQEILETFADVIIAIEYYFDSADNNGHMDESVLKIAEESLSALGVPG